MSSGYINLPAQGDAHWKSPVAVAANLPVLNNSIGDARIDTSTDTIYIWTGSAWVAVATPGAAIAIDGLIGDVSASGPGVVVATINSGVIVNSMINASAAIAYSKLAALTINRAIVSDGSGVLSAATTTSTEIGYVNGVTSAIQTQLNSKQATGNYITALTGDVSATGPGAAAVTVNSVGGKTAAQIATSVTLTQAATTTNTATTLVLRDANGGFNNQNMPSTQIASINNTNSPYSVPSGVFEIHVDSSTGAITVTLPNPNTYRRVRIVDTGGQAGTNNITLARFGSETIQGLAASLILSANFGSYEFQSDGTNWWKVSVAANSAMKTFTSSGNWPAPAGITSVAVYARGGAGGGSGGAGGGGGSTAAAARGGGSGSAGCPALTRSKLLTVVPGTSYTITVGAGGTASAGGAGAVANAAGATGSPSLSAGDGGDTSFGSLATFPGSRGGFNAGAGGIATTGVAAGAAFSAEVTNRAGSAGGVAGSSGTSASSSFRSLTGTGGAGGAGGSSGANIGGGGGGAGACTGADNGACNSNAVAVGGNGGNAGAGGNAGSGASQIGVPGGGGSAGGGGGGGGIVAVTGSAGGNGGDGSAGNDGYVTIRWNE